MIRLPLVRQYWTRMRGTSRNNLFSWAPQVHHVARSPFSSDSASKEWIPPHILPSKDEDQGVDWLVSRRKRLEMQDDVLLTPEEGKLKKQRISDDIPVKMNTLLSKDEIIYCLEALGGRDIIFIYDDPRSRRLGGSMGLVVVTGDSRQQLRMIADSLVRQLRRRNLQENDVIGAQLGFEGSTDDPNEGWFVVDCRNFVVHIQDERTRTAVNLEGWWSDEGMRELDKITSLDDPRVDDWVAANPVPKDYGQVGINFEAQLRDLRRRRYTSAHESTSKPERKRKGRYRR